MKKPRELFYKFNRIGRIKHRVDPHIRSLQKKGTLTTRQKKNIKHIEKIHKRIRIYFAVRNLFLLLLYASAVSAVASDIFILSGVSDFVVKVSGVIGATIWLIGITIFNRLIDLDTADAHVLAAEIIAASPIR